jgi:hypothetical protein
MSMKEEHVPYSGGTDDGGLLPDWEVGRKGGRIVI